MFSLASHILARDYIDNLKTTKIILCHPHRAFAQVVSLCGLPPVSAVGCADATNEEIGTTGENSVEPGGKGSAAPRPASHGNDGAFDAGFLDAVEHEATSSVFLSLYGI